MVAAFLVYIHYQSERIQLRDATISRARAMVSALDREFARTESALLALSTAPLLASNNLSGFHAQARRALKHIDADSIVVLDNSGQMLLSTRSAFGEPLPKLDKTPLLQRIIATGQPGVSDLYSGPLTGIPIFMIGVPVSHDGLGTYSLYATFAPERLSTILSEQKLPNSWRAAIADSSGSVVARSHDIRKFLGKKVTPAVLQRIGKSDEDAFEAKTLDGIPVVTVYSRSQTSRWMVILGTPLSDTTAGIRRTLAWLIAATCAALAIGLALAWLIGGRIARSITALIRPAEALGSGQEIVAIAPLHFKEAYEVGQALVNASAMLCAAITERARAVNVLTSSEAAMKEAQRLAKVGSWRWDAVSNLHTWSEETYRIYGRDLGSPPAGIDEIPAYFTPEGWANLSAALEAALAKGSAFECDAEMVRADGTHIWITARGESMRDDSGSTIGLRGTIQDITERKEAEQLLRKEEHSRHLAFHDSLTGLPNRMLLLDRLEHGIDRAKRENERLALLFIDLDRFKLINDNLGHDVGDELLQYVARRMSLCLRQSDTVARIGGDEFVILLEHVNDLETCVILARKLLDELSRAATLGAHTVQVSASIGIACFPNDATDAVGLMKNSDMAMYAAKAAGRGTYRFFEAAR